jgi:Mg2+/Co2+ transporter CorC
VPGILRFRNVDRDRSRELLIQPYFIPGATPVCAQPDCFQEHSQRVALLADEYGDFEGLATLDDLIEENVGKVPTGVPMEIVHTQDRMVLASRIHRQAAARQARWRPTFGTGNGFAIPAKDGHHRLISLTYSGKSMAYGR